ncbi:hypothetical protein [Paucilactobacillus sp. N302-9]
MKKKLLLSVGMVVAILLVFVGCRIYVGINISENAFYYATHTKHDNKSYPIIYALNNYALPKSVNKKFKSSINSSQNSDGMYANMNVGNIDSENVLKSGDHWNLTQQTIVYYPTTKQGYSKYVMISFNNDYEVQKIEYHHTNKSEANSKNAIKVLNRLTRLLKKSSKKPAVNLQKIYDKKMNSDE